MKNPLSYACSCADAPDNKYFDPVIRHNGSFVKTSGYCTDLFYTAARGWIKEVKDGDQPFFAYITTNAPHGPFIAPPSNTKRFTEQTAGFYGMIENIDENVRKLMANLEDWDLLENTIVIFMSDNGMTGGGSGKPGRDIDTLSAHIDILPTLAELAGAKYPKKQVEDRSLLPLLEDASAEQSDRYLFTQKARWKTGSEPTDSMWKGWAVRSQQYRLVGDELFDMENDPSQTTDIADAHPEVVKKMRQAYEKFWAETRPLMVNEEAPMSPTKPFHELYHAQEKAGGIPAWTPPQL